MTRGPNLPPGMRGGRGPWWVIAPLCTVVLALAALIVVQAQRAPAPSPIAFTELAQQVKSGQITAIEMSDDHGIARARTGQSYTFGLTPGTSLIKTLASFGVTVDQLQQVAYTVAEPPPSWWGLALGFAPFLVFGAIMLFMLRRMQGGTNSPLSFGKSTARVADAQHATITFADVAGVEEPLQELQEVVEFLKYPEKFMALGARTPHGVLLVGPPGTGKTLLARAVAGEAGVPFFSISGSEFVEMFVGVGASRVRDLFERAKRQAPCIVFVDEIDAVGRQRGAGLGGGNDEREQTLNQILVQLDGFEGQGQVIVIAATNRPDVLDPALLRPGRFDRIVIVPGPDLRGRRAILAVHARGKPFDATAALDTLAGQTPGFSGADLANVLNEAAILAARRNKQLIGQPELDEAVDRVLSGPERTSHVLSQTEKRLTAYHESGHAVVARFLPNHDPVHKITIVPRGLRAGYTRFLASEDHAYQTRSQCTDTLAAALAGHATERVVFGELSTGAGDDIERATSIARKMVKECGMSQRLGPVAFGRKQQLVFLGRDIGEQKNYSDQVAEIIDEEIRHLIEQGYAQATSILRAHRPLLDRLAAELMQAETLDAATIERIFAS
jgi:cell division protease FtsH